MADPAFWNKAANKYAASKIADVGGYEETMGRAKALLKPGDHVLEIGCGTGSTAMVLAPHVKHYTGTDIAEGMLRFAHEKQAAASIDNLTFV